MNKICRFGRIVEPVKGELKITENSALLEKWTQEFYDLNPDILRNHFSFFETEDEVLWRFSDLGPKDVFFPTHRLPIDLDLFLKDKSHE